MKKKNNIDFVDSNYIKLDTKIDNLYTVLNNRINDNHIVFNNRTTALILGIYALSFTVLLDIIVHAYHWF